MNLMEHVENCGLTKLLCRKPNPSVLTLIVNPTHMTRCLFLLIYLFNAINSLVQKLKIILIFSEENLITLRVKFINAVL
jgi:hypothetical protein